MQEPQGPPGDLCGDYAEKATLPQGAEAEETENCETCRHRTPECVTVGPDSETLPEASLASPRSCFDVPTEWRLDTFQLPVASASDSDPEQSAWPDEPCAATGGRTDSLFDDDVSFFWGDFEA